jgi:uncharacterized protein YqjF (DUF2071 family)
MTWRDVFFAHWPVDPETVAATLPPGLSVDTDEEGRAWLSVVGFVMDDIAPRFSPVGLSFPELNLRTYVERDGAPGIYFYNLDADDRLGVPVARSLFQLPYYRAEIDVEERGGAIEFRSERTHSGVPPARFDATITPRGDPVSTGADREAQASRAPPDGRAGAKRHASREALPGGDRAPARFLVERYRFYASGDDGTLYYGDIKHEPWELQAADFDVRRNDLFAAAGFDEPAGEPVVHYSRSLPVTAGRIRRV